MTEQTTRARLDAAIGEARYGRTKVEKIKAAYDELRDACRSEGTPRIQDAIDRYEQWADYAYAAKEGEGL